jgi:hypothetical protein
MNALLKIEEEGKMGMGGFLMGNGRDKYLGGNQLIFFLMGVE